MSPLAVLEIKDLHVTRDGKEILKGVNLKTGSGEVHAIMGPNGSGKSTVFNLISDNLSLTSGSIRFDGQELAGLPSHRVCHQGIARTFQIPRPFRKLDLLENVAVSAFFGSAVPIRREEAWKRAKEALGIVKLSGDSSLDVVRLGASGLKKLELARALSTRPRLLLADESLGGLDETEMEQAGEMLEHIRSKMGITIIWVEHIMGILMKVVDRVIVLDHGEKISEGLPNVVAADPKVIEVYLGEKDEVGNKAADTKG